MRGGCRSELQLHGDRQKLIKGTLKYFKPVDKTDTRKGAGDYIETDLGHACTENSYGLVTDTAVSSKIRDKAANYGVDIFKGTEKFAKKADPTLLIDGRNPSQFTDHLADLHDTYHANETSQAAIFEQYQGFIDTVSNNSELQKFKKIKKASTAMQSTMHSDPVPKDYTFETYESLKSGATSSNFSPSSLALGLLTVGTIGATALIS